MNINASEINQILYRNKDQKKNTSKKTFNKIKVLIFLIMILNIIKIKS